MLLKLREKHALPDATGIQTDMPASTVGLIVGDKDPTLATTVTMVVPGFVPESLSISRVHPKRAGRQGRPKAGRVTH